MGSLDWISVVVSLLLIMNFLGVVAGFVLCCHPERESMKTRRQLLGIAEPEYKE